MVRKGPAIGVLAQLALLVVLAALLGLSAASWLVGVSYGLGMNAVLAAGLRRSGATRLGLPNCVTLTRAILAGGVAALVADSYGHSTHVIALVPLAALALALDAVDGWVARRTATASLLGARFDMEIDAFLILVLSIAVAPALGPWVLTIGLARYAFVAAGWLFTWLQAASPPRPWCKVVAALQGIVLTVCAADVLPTAAELALTAVALALLGESFGRQTWWLWRAHRALRSAPSRVTLLIPAR
jgi:phosphatidylglycerophosphate synthase